MIETPKHAQISRYFSNTSDEPAPMPQAAAGSSGRGASSAAGRSTMRAIVQKAYGSADTLQLQTIERPTLGANEVLIEVRAAGLDRGTWHLMTGTPYLMRILGFGFSKPKQAIPGLDVAGTVVAVGAAVKRFAVGDEVFGMCRSGSFAEYAAASEDKLARKPANVSFERAAATAVSGITALQALTEVGRLQAGQGVLVVGASGGVGSFAVQLAKALGAEVTAVASTGKLDLVRSLGADHVLDYTRDDFLDGGHRYDLIVDIGGRNPIARLRRVLSSQGTLVLVGGEGGNRLTGGIGRQIGASLLSAFVSQRLAMFVSSGNPQILSRIAGFLESGAVVPSIGQRFGLDAVPTAIRQLEAGEARGKSVIVVRS